MTLVITIATAKRVIQVSDRRLTWMKDSQAYRYDDDENKGIVVCCKNAHFCVAYTGVGKVGTISTDDLIAKCFGSVSAGTPDFPKIFHDFARILSFEFKNYLKRLPTPASALRTIIVCSGFILAGVVFSVRISNYESWDCNAPNDYMTFKVIIDLVAPTRPDKRSKKIRHRPGLFGGVWGSGECAFVQHFGKLMMQLRRARYFHRASSEAVEIKMVELIRIVADDPSSGVGRNCMSVVLFAKPRGALGGSFRYHSVDGSAIQYGPHFVLGGSVLADFEVRPARAETSRAGRRSE